MHEPYDNDNVFAKILRQEIPSIKVYEDEHTLAFMDVMPQIDGHVLVIPKERAATIFELSDTAALACMRTVKKVGKAVQTAMDAPGITTFQQNGKGIGQTVPHFHIHVLPGSLLNLRGHAVQFADPEGLKAFAAKIIAHLD
ncbi:HIT domain-containing protein [Shewanella sp. A25]|nr:HIT domain-containing protein [Shewanella shenzhenensis]